MKVVLLERVVNLGNLGDIVDVKNGYARNFLIPFAKVKRATAANLQEFELKRKEYELNQTDILGKAKARRELINEQLFTIKAKALVDGKLFGSITANDIVEIVNKTDAMHQANIQIKKHEVMLPHGPIKNIGTYDISLILHHDVHAMFKIQVMAE